MADALIEDVEVIAALSPLKRGKRGAQCFVCGSDLEGVNARFIILSPLEEGEGEKHILACADCCEDFSFMVINHVYVALKVLSTIYGDVPATSDDAEEEEVSSEVPEEPEIENTEDDNIIESEETPEEPQQESE